MVSITTLGVMLVEIRQIRIDPKISCLEALGELFCSWERDLERQVNISPR